MQGFSFANVDHFSTASLITRLTTDVTNVQQSFMMIIRTLVRSPLMLIAATIMAVRLNAELAVVFEMCIRDRAGAAQAHQHPGQCARDRAAPHADAHAGIHRHARRLRAG